MNKLEQSHWGAILSGCQLDSDEYEHNKNAVGTSTTITIEAMKGFAEFVSVNLWHYNVIAGMWWNEIETGEYQTTDQLIENYIKTL